MTLETYKPRKVKRLIWDIETSPNIGMFWRAGYKLSIQPSNIIRERAVICICYKWEGEKKVHHLEWDMGDDGPMLEKFLEVAHEADELVAHNGDKFDIRWFNTRCLIHGLEPMADWKTVDTLVIARKRFYLNSNRLDYIGKLLFGEGKGDDGGFSTWEAILLENCPKAMKLMVSYCKKDVRLLERVWKALEPYHKPKTHAGVLAGGEKWQCPWTGSTDVIKSKTRVTAAGTVQHQMFSNEKQGYYCINECAFKRYQQYREDKKKAKRKWKK